MSAEAILSTIGTITSFLAGLTQTITIYSNKKAGIKFYMPINFLRVSHLCQVAWLLYGLMLANPSLIIVNIFTTLLTWTNLILYQSIYEKYSEVLSKYAVLIGVFCAFLGLLRTVENIGTLSGILSVVTFVTTFEAMKLAIQNRNREYIEIKMTLVCLFNSLVWGAVGVVIPDATMIYSNAISIGILLLSTGIYVVLSFS